MDASLLREPLSSLTHALGLVLAIPATLLLRQRSRGCLRKRISFSIFGISLALCYAASASFHAVRGSDALIETFRRADLICVFTLIAGSYTPLACGLMHGSWRWGTLATAWLTALILGIVIACGYELSLPLQTGLYLAAGWGVVACLRELRRRLPMRRLMPIIAGGALYSVGAVLNVLRWPSPWPGVFGHHEVFHLFVLAGSAMHFSFMLGVVAPYPQGETRAAYPGAIGA